MQFHKYINKMLLAVSIVVVTAAFLLLNIDSYADSSYNSYQHPFLTVLIIGLYILMIVKYDFTGSMFVTRFKSPARCMLRTAASLSLFSFVYYSGLFGAFMLISLLTKGAVLVGSAVLCYVYTQLTLIVINVFYVVLSLR